MFLGLESVKLRPNIHPAHMHGLGSDKSQKIADGIDSFAQGVSRAIRGERADTFSLGSPVPIQNVILIVGLGFVGYKLIELAVRGRH